MTMRMGVCGILLGRRAIVLESHDTVYIVHRFYGRFDVSFLHREHGVLATQTTVYIYIDF